MSFDCVPESCPELRALHEEVDGLRLAVAHIGDMVGANDAASIARHGETMRRVDELAIESREGRADLRRLLLAQLAVVALVVCILGGVVGVRSVISDGAGHSVDVGGAAHAAAPPALDP